MLEGIPDRLTLNAGARLLGVDPKTLANWRDADRRFPRPDAERRYSVGALAILKDKGPLSPSLFKQNLREDLAMSKNDADVLTAKLVDGGAAVRWRAGGFHPSYMIGLPGQEKPASPAYREAGREAQ